MHVSTDANRSAIYTATNAHSNRSPIATSSDYFEFEFMITSFKFIDRELAIAIEMNSCR